MKSTCLALIAVLLLGSIVRADDTGITVSATGEVKGKPNTVEIGAVVNAEAELTADAIVKYREAKKKSVTALEGLKLQNLAIDSAGFTVNQAQDQQQQMRVMNGMPAGNAKQKVEVTESMKLTVKNVDKMEPEQVMDTLLKVIDTGRDAGLVIGPPPARNYWEAQQMAQMGRGQSMVGFKILESASLKEQAYKLAMDNANAKAKRLADLAGVKLGRVVSVQEAVGKTTSENQSENFQMAMARAAFGITSDAADPTSNLFTDIPVKVVLTVQYEIQK